MKFTIKRIDEDYINEDLEVCIDSYYQVLQNGLVVYERVDWKEDTYPLILELAGIDVEEDE